MSVYIASYIAVYSYLVSKLKPLQNFVDWEIISCGWVTCFYFVGMHVAMLAKIAQHGTAHAMLFLLA